MTLAERYAQRLGDFQSSLEKLREAVACATSDLERDGTIQRFEFTYEQAWKTLKLWLAHKDIQALNPKDALRAAVEQGLISNPDLWARIHESRNLTSHTYDEKAAADIFAFLKSQGLGAFDSLLTTLQTRPPT